VFDPKQNLINLLKQLDMSANEIKLIESMDNSQCEDLIRCVHQKLDAKGVKERKLEAESDS
jgi:hypothetical protein